MLNNVDVIAKMVVEFNRDMRMIKQQEEDHPGQRDEVRRHRIIEFSHKIADSIICDEADGSTEELDYLTMEVAFKFLESVKARTSSNLLRKGLER